MLTGSASATFPQFCIGDGRAIGVATENNKNASKLHTRGRDAKGTVEELVRYRVPGGPLPYIIGLVRD